MATKPEAEQVATVQVNAGMSPVEIPVQLPPLLPTADLLTPERAAYTLAPRLAEHTSRSDYEGGFPEEELAWLRVAGLLKAPLSVEFGGANLAAVQQTAVLLTTLKHLGRGNLAVGRIYEDHVNALQLVLRFGRPRSPRWPYPGHCQW